MATLQQSIDWARNNQDDPKAKALKEMIISGQADERARAEGVDLSWAGRQIETQVPEKKGFIDTQKDILIGEERADRVKNIVNPYREGKQGAVETIFQLGGDVLKTAFESATNIPVVKEGLGLAMKIISVYGEATKEAPFIKQTGDFLSPAITAYENLSDRQKRNVDSALEYLSVLPVEKIASIGLKTTLKGGEEALRLAGTTPEFIGAGYKLAKDKTIDAVKGLTERATKYIYGEEGTKLTEKLAKQYASDISLPKNLMRSEAETGKSFFNFMAEKPHLSIPVKDMKYDTWATAQTLRQEVKAEAKALEELIATQQGTVYLDDIGKNIMERIDRELVGQEAEAAKKYIISELETIKGQMGEGLSLVDATKLKQKMWDRSPFNPTASRSDRLASNLDYKIGQELKKAIENSIDDVDIKMLNNEIGDYYNAIDTLERIHGNPAKKGRLGIELAKMTGAIAGSPGGFLGSVIGYMTADKIVQVLADPSLTSAMKRYMLRELNTARPTVAEQVKNILIKQGKEAEARLLLPAPGETSRGVIEVAPRPKEGTVRQDYIGGQRDNLVFPETPLTKGEIPNTTTELLQEARKYKSLDEFVKAQGTPVYHGGTEIKEVGNMRSKWGAFYMTDNPTYAKSYGGNKSFLNEMVITTEAKLADLRKPSSDIVKQIEDIISPKKTGKTFKIQKPDGSFIEVPETKGGLSNPVHSSADIIQGIKDGKAYYAEMPEVKKALKKLGYDGMITQESKFGANYGVWNKNVIKTKSQLTDIWKKANRKP